jgi:hypothetical protein
MRARAGVAQVLYDNDGSRTGRGRDRFSREPAYGCFRAIALTVDTLADAVAVRLSSPPEVLDILTRRVAIHAVAFVDANRELLHRYWQGEMQMASGKPLPSWFAYELRVFACLGCRRSKLSSPRSSWNLRIIPRRFARGGRRCPPIPQASRIW